MLHVDSKDAECCLKEIGELCLCPLKMFGWVELRPQSKSVAPGLKTGRYWARLVVFC